MKESNLGEAAEMAKEKIEQVKEFAMEDVKEAAGNVGEKVRGVMKNENSPDAKKEPRSEETCKSSI